MPIRDWMLEAEKKPMARRTAAAMRLMRKPFFPLLMMPPTRPPKQKVIMEMEKVRDAWESVQPNSDWRGPRKMDQP